MNLKKMLSKCDRWIWVIVLITLIKGLVWASVFPLFQAPDEEAHFAYVQYWVENKEIPWLLPQDRENGLSKQFDKTLNTLEFNEVKFNPLYQQDFKSDSIMGTNEKEIIQNQLDPKSNRDYQGYSYPPLPHLLNIPAYLLFRGDVLAQAMAMRLTSVFLSIITMLLIYSGLRQLFEDKKMAVGTTVLIMFQPMFSYLSSVINNDGLMNLAYAGFFMSAIKIIKKKTAITWREGAELSLWVVLGIASKTQGYALLALLGIFLLMKVRTTRKNKTKKYFSLILGGILITLMGGKFLIGENQGQLGLYKSYFESHSLWEMGETIGFYYQTIFESFWGNFGWLDTLLPDSALKVIALIIVVSMGGLFYYFGENRNKTDKAMIFLAFSSFLVGSLYLFYFLNAVVSTDVLINGRATQGRYYFIIIFPLFALGIKGLEVFFKAEKKHWMMFALCLLMVWLHWIALFEVIIPRYYV